MDACQGAGTKNEKRIVDTISYSVDTKEDNALEKKIKIPSNDKSSMSTTIYQAQTAYTSNSVRKNDRLC